MIIMSDFSNPFKNRYISNGEIKSLDLNDYNVQYSQGISEQVDDNTIIGLYINEYKLYLVINSSVYDIYENKISCENKFIANKRFFELKSDNNVIFRKEYDPLCSIEDLLSGEIEEEQDFLLYLTNILSSENEINKFIQGHALKK